MALKTEFDSKSFNIVLVRSLTGALVGALPGTIYIIVTGRNLVTDTFGVALTQMGVLAGAIILGLASAAATINATLKSRGTGPSGKANRLKEYLNPEVMPVIPPPARQPVAKDNPDDFELTEVNLPAVPVPPAKPVQKTPTATNAPVAVQPEQPVFEDFDRS